MPLPVTGAAAVVAFCAWQRRRNLSAATIRHRRFRLTAFEQWLEKDLLEATAEDIDRWLDAHQLAPQTRYTYISYLAAFYSWAIRQRLVSKDPTEDVIRPKLPKRLPRPISAEDLEVAVDLADVRMRAWLLLAAFAGARCMEIAALRVEDIHRERGVILLRGKGDKERLVPLHPEVLDALTRYGLPRAGYVFRREDGKSLSPSTISRYGGRFLQECGIPATMHQLRHFFGTAMYRLSGGDLLMTKDLLGHESASSTAIYAGWDPAKSAPVVEAMRLRQPEEVRE